MPRLHIVQPGPYDLATHISDDFIAPDCEAVALQQGGILLAVAERDTITLHRTGGPEEGVEIPAAGRRLQAKLSADETEALAEWCARACGGTFTPRPSPRLSHLVEPGGILCERGGVYWRECTHPKCGSQQELATRSSGGKPGRGRPA